jgi:hypothetical protein
MPWTVQGLLAAESAAVELAELQKLVLKILWSALYMSVPPLLAQPAQFQAWLACLLEAVRRPVPQVPFSGIPHSGTIADLFLTQYFCWKGMLGESPVHLLLPTLAADPDVDVDSGQMSFIAAYAGHLQMLCTRRATAGLRR